MLFRKVVLEVIVTDDDEECMIQALNCAMEKIEDQLMIFGSEIKVLETNEPEYAKEISALAH
jgi:hypothetical protein